MLIRKPLILVMVFILQLDQSFLQDCVERQASFARPSSLGSENRLTAMCSDGNTKSTDDSSSVLKANVGSELLERTATLVEFDERLEASEHWVPVETALRPAPASAHCLSTRTTNLVIERESCVTSRELQYFNGHLLGPDASHHRAGEEEGSQIESAKDLSLGESLHTNVVVWQSIEAQGESPIQYSKAQHISILEELRRVAASSGQKARRLEGDTASFSCAIVDIQIEEIMDMYLRPNAPTYHVQPDNFVVREFDEETSSENSDPLQNNSDNNALECAEREAAGNSSVSQTEDEGHDELQATLTYQHFRRQAKTHDQNPVLVEPEPLPLISTSQIGTEDQSLTICEDPLSSIGIFHINSKQRCTNTVSIKGAKMRGIPHNLQDYEAEEQVEGSRKGKRKRCEEDLLTNATSAIKLKAGLTSSTIPSNYMVRYFYPFSRCNDMSANGFLFWRYHL